MRTNVIPAQVTTVEDKIAGNLSFTQIILLLTSLFLSVFIYAVFPTKLEFTLFKVLIIIFVLLVFFTLSLRVKDKIILSWLILFVSYWTRPKLYVFDKNDTYLRRDAIFEINSEKNKKAVIIQKRENAYKITNTNLYSFESLLSDPKTDLAFKFKKKGGLSVTVSDK